jgi:CheY-like chemotaxis protein
MSTNPAKLLVIEDNPGDVALLRFALDQHKEEYELEVLADGQAAIHFVRAQGTLAADPDPCVIVLDINLPKEDGKSVLIAIKNEPVLAHVQVIALSSFVSPRDEMEILSLGARLYRAKPMKLDDWFLLAAEVFAVCHESIAMTA